METKIGQIIKVKINGKSYDTVITPDNVQRFFNNSLIRHLVDSEQVDLNRLRRDYANGKFTLKYYQEFYMGMGYSVCVFDELFGINSNLEDNEHAIIENPLWE
jgi:hypothetical protein